MLIAALLITSAGGIVILIPVSRFGVQKPGTFVWSLVISRQINCKWEIYQRSDPGPEVIFSQYRSGLINKVGQSFK